MNREDHWAQFLKTGSVNEYLAYKNVINHPQGENVNAPVDRRPDNKGEYSKRKR